jgi:hypothetical protein
VSADWNIKCLDCNSIHGFDDANHEDELMALLCMHADVIAALAPLLTANRDIEFRTRWGSICPDWFQTHKGHRLCPIDEYGGLLGQCCEYVRCACGSNRRCVLDAGHDGEHATVRP